MFYFRLNKLKIRDNIQVDYSMFGYENEEGGTENGS